MASKKSKFYNDKVKRQELISKYGNSETDTGSPMVQIAIMSERITYLTDHLKDHKGDNHSRRGLLKLVSARRKMIKYLKANESDSEKVNKFLKQMGL